MIENQWFVMLYVQVAIGSPVAMGSWQGKLGICQGKMTWKITVVSVDFCLLCLHSQGRKLPGNKKQMQPSF